MPKTYHVKLKLDGGHVATVEVHDSEVRLTVDSNLYRLAKGDAWRIGEALCSASRQAGKEKA